MAALLIYTSGILKNQKINQQEIPKQTEESAIKKLAESNKTVKDLLDTIDDAKSKIAMIKVLIGEEA